jgi:hypothetical protein
MRLNGGGGSSAGGGGGHLSGGSDVESSTGSTSTLNNPAATADKIAALALQARLTSVGSPPSIGGGGGSGGSSSNGSGASSIPLPVSKISTGRQPPTSISVEGQQRKSPLKQQQQEAVAASLGLGATHHGSNSDGNSRGPDQGGAQDPFSKLPLVELPPGRQQHQQQLLQLQQQQQHQQQLQRLQQQQQQRQQQYQQLQQEHQHQQQQLQQHLMQATYDKQDAAVQQQNGQGGSGGGPGKPPDSLPLLFSSQPDLPGTSTGHSYSRADTATSTSQSKLRRPFETIPVPKTFFFSTVRRHVFSNILPTWSSCFFNLKQFFLSLFYVPFFFI